MKIIALEKAVSGVKPDQFAPFAVAEARAAWELYQAGIVREMYLRKDLELNQNWLAAVLILECEDVSQARQALNRLPLVEKGLIAFDVYALTPHNHFAKLFANPNE